MWVDGLLSRLQPCLFAHSSEMTLGPLARRSAATARQVHRPSSAKIQTYAPSITRPTGRRTFHASISRPDNIPSWPAPPVPQPPVTPSDPPSSSSSTSSSSNQNTSGSGFGSSSGSGSWFSQWTSSASFQAALTTVVGLGMVFGAGVGYLEWYKSHVLHRVRPHPPQRSQSLADENR